jgi:hypothetical protein
MSAGTPTDATYMTVKEMVTEIRNDVKAVVKKQTATDEFVAVMASANLPARVDHIEKVQDVMAGKLIVVAAVISIVVGLLTSIIASVVASQILDAIDAVRP